MYSELKRQAISKRKAAIKKGIPDPFLKLGEYYIDKAIYLRNQKKTKASAECPCYTRAKELLWTAQEVFDAHLNNRFSEYKTPSLSKEI